MHRKIGNIILYLIIIVGIIIFTIGIFKIFFVKQKIADGVKEVEELFGNIEEGQTHIEKMSTAIEVAEEENNIDKSQELSAIGLLTIKLDKDYKVAIYENVTTETLKKGAGRITGSSYLNEKGNCVLYGHRDSAFKPLWHIAIGDKVAVKSFYSEIEYEVYNIYITTPEDSKIVEQSDANKLTLVTCYPFTYSGAAKQRCVVECERIFNEG